MHKRFPPGPGPGPGPGHRIYPVQSVVQSWIAARSSVALPFPTSRAWFLLRSLPRHGFHKLRETQLDISLALHLELDCFLGCRLLPLAVGAMDDGRSPKRYMINPLSFSPYSFFDLRLSLSRPRSMPGGDLHWLWKPYGLYMTIDYVSHASYQPYYFLELTHAGSRFTVSLRLSAATASRVHKVRQSLRYGTLSSNLNSSSVPKPY